MSRTNELIDDYKKRLNLPSDYAAAKALGLRPNRISNYRCGVSHADDKTAVMLADALELDRLKTIAEINSDRASSARDRTFWRNVAKAASVVILLSATTHETTAASAISCADNSQQMHIMFGKLGHLLRCIMDFARVSSLKLYRIAGVSNHSPCLLA